jgi:hypothetical protein
MTSDYIRNLEGHLSELFGELASVEPLRQDNQHGMELAVCNMSYSRDSSGSAAYRRIRQTVVVLDAEELNLPQFAISPESKGLLGKIFEGLGGFGDIDFEDSPEFSGMYHLHGWVEKPVRMLFTKAIRDHFATQPGWSVRGKGSCLVVFKHNHICGDDETSVFVQEALKILSLFSAGEKELDAHLDVRRETRPEDVASTADRMGGIVGTLIQSQLRKIAVTRDELEAFLHETPPRNIPTGLKRQVLGDNFPLIIVGGVFLVTGLVAGTLVLLLTTGNERWIGVPFLIVFPIIGGLMMGLTIRYRQRKARVLRYGFLTDGTVTDVSRSNTMVNNQLRFLVTVAYSVDGQNRTTRCHSYGMAVEQARAVMETGQPARILIDPSDPKHVVCADLVTIFEQSAQNSSSG